LSAPGESENGVVHCPSNFPYQLDWIPILTGARSGKLLYLYSKALQVPFSRLLPSTLANVLLVCRAVVATSLRRRCVFRRLCIPSPGSGYATCCVYQQAAAAVNTHTDLIMLEAPKRILCTIQMEGHWRLVILRTTSSNYSSD
jgi:hypothetical protein